MNNSNIIIEENTKYIRHDLQAIQQGAAVSESFI